jgi:hypothetical protein
MRYQLTHTNPKKCNLIQTLSSLFWTNYWLTRIPVNLTARSNSDTQITLNWTNIGSGFVGNKIYHSTDGVNYHLEYSSATIINSYVATVIAGDNNFYYVTAYRSGSNSNPSNIARGGVMSFNFAVPLIPAPVTFSYIATSGNVTVEWGDGNTSTLTCDNSLRSLTHNYAIGGVTYTVKLRGDLFAVTRIDISIVFAEINISEFAKAENFAILFLININEVSGSINLLNKLKEIWISNPVVANTGLTGDFASTPLLEVFECNTLVTNRFTCKITGLFSDVQHLTHFCSLAKVVGDISLIKDIQYFSWGYLIGNDPATAVIQPDDSVVRIWGDISDHTDLWYYACNGGASTVIGDLTLLVNLESLNVTDGLTKPASLVHLTKLCEFQSGSWALSQTEVNQYLADIWTNREVVRTHFQNTPGTLYDIGHRTIFLYQNALNPAPSGQGLIDMINLMNTISPIAPGTGSAWIITTNMALGGELVDNPAFAAVGSWLVNGGCTISGGRLRFPGVGIAGFGYQVIIPDLPVGIYLCSVKVDSFTAGLLSVYVVIDPGVNYIDSAKTFYFLFTGTGATAVLYIQSFAVSTTATVSYASMKPII